MRFPEIQGSDVSAILCDLLIRFFLFEERYKEEFSNISKTIKLSDHFRYRTKTLIHGIELLDFFKSRRNQTTLTMNWSPT